MEKGWTLHVPKFQWIGIGAKQIQIPCEAYMYVYME